CSGRQVRTLERTLGRAGAVVGVASETQGEARDQHWRAVPTHRLLVEVTPAEWDAIVFVGGRGAARVTEDELARATARAFAAGGRVVAAVGEGGAVLARAGVSGVVADSGEQLASALEQRLRTNGNVE